MDKLRQIEQTLMGSRRALVLAASLVFALLAAAVGLTTLFMRQNIRDQIARRDGEVLYAVALMHFAEDRQEGLEGPITDPGSQLSVVLRCSQLRGVLGVRIFDPEGRFVESFPPAVREQNLPASQVARVKRFRPDARFYPRRLMSDEFYREKLQPSTVSAALLEVDVPLHLPDSPLAGIAQFIVEGQSIAAEYARLDRQLALQAAVALAAGAAALGLTAGWAFRRLRRAHRLVAERTRTLVLANQELALAARTSALGAVTAHLIHGLKNPLAGLRQYVATRGSTPDPAAPDSDWQQAVASTRRMQAMIDQVVGVLREDQARLSYEVSLSEAAQLVSARLQPLAREKGVRFETVIQTEAVLPNRVANLVTLILIDLAENAVQATPAGKDVHVHLRAESGDLVFEVRDQGPGFPEGLQVFKPCASTKEDGAGIGLAMCKQLANHLEASLELTANSSSGCTFTLKLHHEEGRTGSSQPAVTAKASQPQPAVSRESLSA